MFAGIFGVPTSRPTFAFSIALSIAACGGDPFDNAPAAGIAGAPGVGDMTVVTSPHPDAEVPSGGNDAAPGLESGSRGDCDPRGGDAPDFTREVCISAATFVMGLDGQNLGASFADHTPAHSVMLSAHYLDAYEVTVGRYRRCVDAAACTPPKTSATTACTFEAGGNGSDALPVNCVAWEQARAFCAWDGGRRLPTEAEWEYAARGAGDRSYPWGVQTSCDRAVLGGYSGGPCAQYRGPMLAGSLSAGASPDGVFDLAGNAAEWVSDWAGSYEAKDESDPVGPPAGAVKIVRGGSWDSAWPAALGYARLGMPPTALGSWGFRCARDMK